MASNRSVNLSTDIDPSIVLSKAVARAAERLNISRALLAKILGVSAPTITRLTCRALFGRIPRSHLRFISPLHFFSASFRPDERPACRAFAALLTVLSQQVGLSSRSPWVLILVPDKVSGTSMGVSPRP